MSRKVESKREKLLAINITSVRSFFWDFDNLFRRKNRYVIFGELYQPIDSNKDDAIHIVHEITKAVNFLNIRNIIHLNLTPDNIVQDLEGKTIKLTGFESCYYYDSKHLKDLTDHYHDRILKEKVKTPENLVSSERSFEAYILNLAKQRTWRPPEIIVCSRNCINQKTTVWSIGLLLLYYFKGKLPFEKMLEKAGHESKLLAGIEDIGGVLLPRKNYKRFLKGVMLKYRKVISRPINYKRWKSSKTLFWTGGQNTVMKPYGWTSLEKFVDDEIFINLVRKILIANPNKRLNLNETESLLMKYK